VACVAAFPRKSIDTKPIMGKQAKSYTVSACCHIFKTRFILRHDGLKWSDSTPYEETVFQTRKEAEAFAADESAMFEVPHTMEIREHLLD